MKLFGILALFVLLGPVLAACGGDGDDETSTCEITFAGEVPDAPGVHRIYCVNADGSDLEQLTDRANDTFGDEDYEAFPAWSPDGSKVAFIRGGDAPGIYIVESDGSDDRLLAEGWATDISWSPDGNQLAFSWIEEGWPSESRFPFQLVVINADGSNMQIISDHPDLRNPSVNDFRPSWEPDGSRILFHHFGLDTRDLYLVHADGSGLQRIDTGDLNVYYGSVNITWMPDGEALAIYGDGPDAPDLPSLFRLPLAGEEPERLTPVDRPILVGIVSWSPDGSQMAYGSTAQNLEAISPGDIPVIDLYVIDVESGDSRQLTNTPDEIDGAGGWAPDGDRLLYGSQLAATLHAEEGHLEEGFQFQIINVDDTNGHVVVDGISTQEELAGGGGWRPTAE